MGEDFEPEFLGTVDNVTVVEGREAVLSCSVTRLRDFKVGWIKVIKDRQRLIETLFCDV